MRRIDEIYANSARTSFSQTSWRNRIICGQEDEDTKRAFVESFFDILERLDIEKLPNERELLPFFALKLPSIAKEWKMTPKANRSVIKKIIFELLKDYFFGK